MEPFISLAQLPVGGIARVKQLLSTGSMRRTLQDIGLIQGTRVRCVQKSPAGDPIAYEIRGAVIALRTDDSSQILIQPSE